MRHGYLPRILENVVSQPGDKELIAVVSPCQDETLATLQQYPQWKVLETTARNRAQRLTAGIQISRGEVVLLHHPATLLPHDALTQITKVITDPDKNWGGFYHSFDMDHWLLRFTSWYSNWVRSQYSHILYLDHCIFARRDLLQKIGGVPDMDIFEDTALSQRLRQFGAPVLIKHRVTTSARRFRQRGVYRQAAMNQLLKLMYHARLDPTWMNRLYEYNSQINVSYRKEPGEKPL